MVLGAYALGFRTLGRLARCAVYHEPNHIPVPWPGPILTTVHDLSALRHPEWHPADRVRWYEGEFSVGVAHTTHFVTVSEFTRREMIDLLGIAAERITVVPLAARRVFQPRSPEELAAFRAKSGWPREYVLFVGTMEPRKNLARALAAYARLPLQLRQRFTLVIAGSAGWGDRSVQDLANQLGIAEQVRFAGYVGDSSLAWLCAAARVLLWPSLYEGFGLPLLECMACGTPVIAGRTSAMPELVGDAGLLVDPLDEADVSHALRSALEDDSLARKLAERGLQRSTHFSWSRCAAEHARLYRRIAAS